MRGGSHLTIGLVFLELLLHTAAHRCDRTPEGHVAPKIPADNRFQLKISGAPEKYVPGEGYTISLHGIRSHGQVAQKFTGFMLVVEAQNHMPLRVLTPRDVTMRPVGLFQLYGDTLTKFSPSCPNMVTHTSSMPKSEIQVRWTAPPPGSGCVIFKATVIEYRDVWYQDDGPLSKMLCEEIQESHDTQPDVMENCCACDEAKYEVTFEGLWSRHTHPKDFPSNSWLTRFSDVIGASHSTDYRFWEYGGFASEGLRQVAERGSTRMLESELKAQSQNIRTIIKARGISYPNVTGKTFAVFRVDKLHHLMSLVSMIDPSPDWIVGVSALELCLRNCSWVESKVLNLYPWDAGTDSGITYISPDQQSFPRDKIRRITSSFPNDPRSPFYDPSGAEMKPLARLYLTRQRLYEKTCEEEPTLGNECTLSEWSDWGQCSAPCGPGYKHRQRHYLHRSQSQNCRRVRLTEKKRCVARPCRQASNPSFSRQQPDSKFPPEPTPEPVDPECEVHEWTDWSRCVPVDHLCKHGSQKRYRTVKARDRTKYCLKIPNEEERECRPSTSPVVCPKPSRDKVPLKDPQSSTCCAENEKVGDEEVIKDPDYGESSEIDPEYPEGDDEQTEGGGNESNGGDYEVGEEPTGECAMTQWSVWSPCSVSCGVGETQRFRQLLNPPDEEHLEPRVEYLRAPRNDDTDYGTYDENEKGGVTSSEYGEGPCSAYRMREVMSCNGTYLTCQLSAEDARATEPDDQTTTEESVTDDASEGGEGELQSRSHIILEGTERPVRNCKFSRWSEWSKCEAPCNQWGVRVRTRHIEVHARNGGRDCTGKTKKERKCIRRCKHRGDGEIEEVGSEEAKRSHEHCKYSDWSEWTECTSTCGYNAMRQRTRLVLEGDPVECNDRIRRKTCNVGSCPQ